MAKTLGIDYGSKRVGIAFSDDTGTVAFPKVVLENDKELLGSIVSICEKNHIEDIVMGDSKNFQGVSNSVAKEAKQLRELLEKETNIKIKLQDEFLTSVEARRVDDSVEFRDAHAAALILQRYLDKTRNETN